MFTRKNLLIAIFKNIIISLIIISITIVAIYFIKIEIEKITNSIVLRHKLESELNNKTETIAQLEEDIKVVGDKFTLINKAFIPSNNISEFINTLDKIGADNKITQAYRFETPILTGVVEPFPFASIQYYNNITSDIKSFSNYLKTYENIPYFTKIESINISSQDKIGWLGVSVISIKANLLTKSIQ